MKIDGCEFNHETNTRDLRTKSFDVAGPLGIRTTLSVTMPDYIFQRITASDWDRCRLEVTEHLGQLVDESIRQGYAFREDAKEMLIRQTAGYLREWVYNHFGKTQETAGNDAWAVPVTLEGGLWMPTQL